MSLVEDRMPPATAACYRAILFGLIGQGYYIEGVEESGNVDGHFIITTRSGISIEFGPSYEDDEENDE